MSARYTLRRGRRKSASDGNGRPASPLLELLGVAFGPPAELRSWQSLGRNRASFGYFRPLRRVGAGDSCQSSRAVMGGGVMSTIDAPAPMFSWVEARGNTIDALSTVAGTRR